MPSTDNTFLARRSPLRARLIMATAAVAAVALVGAVALSHGSGTPRRTAATAEPMTPASSAPAAVATSPSAAASPARLPRGKRRVNGVAVGYPQTALGAVAASAEYATQLWSTLDADRAAAIGDVINDPGSGRPTLWYADATTQSRQHLGLPASGGVPTGASVNLGPVSYQLRDVHTDRMTVLLLCYLTTVTPAQGLRNMYVLLPTRLVWAGGDWKYSTRPAGESDFPELRFPPGSAQATAAGWLPLTA